MVDQAQPFWQAIHEKRGEKQRHVPVGLADKREFSNPMVAGLVDEATAHPRAPPAVKS